ncbi:hypothetical protein F9K78_03815 [Brucella pseudintermedia]|nr:hypothetical protein F9K78_03815 [Brucella pseudintermedia]
MLSIWATASGRPPATRCCASSAKSWTVKPGAMQSDSRKAVPVKTEPLYPFVLPHYPTHRSGIRNQSNELISPRRRFTLLARKCSNSRSRSGAG